jgi:HAD superfamily hydrolase (TIGR01509 family)
VAALIGSKEKQPMKKTTAITCLFLDVGGVLLTDGWSHAASKLAAKKFGLDLKELDTRHHQALETYELGKFALSEYLNLVVFYQPRPFTRAQFRKFMFAQSKPFPDMLALVRRLKARYGLKIFTVNNEGPGLNEYRIRRFHLDGFVDSFVSSCFVNLRKPDPDIFRIALATAQVPPDQVVYIDNTPMFVQIGKRLGIRSILHSDYRSTRAKLAAFGLPDEKGAAHEAG